MTASHPSSLDPRALWVGDQPSAPHRQALERLGMAVQHQGWAGIRPEELARFGVVVLEVPPERVPAAQALCRRWRIELGDRPVPLFWLASSDHAGLLAGALDSGADAALPLSAPVELFAAQARALARTGTAGERLAAKADEARRLNARLQQAYQQIEADLELARRIHRGFLPKHMPAVGGTRFAVCYRPRSRVGGDFYDAFRLDEHRVGFFCADAVGRGLPASSLISIFVKKSLFTKEISGSSYRLVPPGEVLTRLNKDLVGLSLPEPPFVTMCYAQLDARTGEISFARAAHPHPLHVPAQGDPEYWHSAGTLLGVYEADFAGRTETLSPGDRVIFYSDGVHPPHGDGPGSPGDPLLAAARRHRRLDLAAFTDLVARDALERSTHQEDFTLVVAEYRGGEG